MTSGGAQRVIANLANYFAQNGHSVRIITFIEGNAYQLDSRIERVEFHEKILFIKSSIIRGFLYLLKFYLNKKNRPNIISSHIGFLGYTTIPICKIYGINLIVSEHFNHVHQTINVERKILWNVLYRYADAVTILTSFDLDFFKSRSKRVIVMENPCSFDIIQNTDNPREKVILAVGDLNRYKHKGFDNLIEIASKVLPKHKDWKIKIVGTGDEGTKYLKHLVENLGLSEQIIFSGYRNDVKELMAKSEIYILTSRYEGLPMVLLEALSQGMACISYDCITGPADIIENQKNGLLIPDQNKEALIDGLESLITNEPLRNHLKSNSSTALNKFHIDNVGQKWVDLINDLI